MPRTLAVDNASGAGRRDAGGEVALSRVFEAFVDHCRLDVRFRNPYSGNGKGGVENAVGFLRRDLMVPPMEAETRERLTRLMPAKRDGLGRSIRYRTPDPIDMMFADDVKSLRPLPSRRFDAVRWETRKADKYGYADIDGNRYQIGANMHGGRVDVAIRAARVAVKDEAGRAIAELDSRGQSQTTAIAQGRGIPRRQNPREPRPDQPDHARRPGQTPANKPGFHRPARGPRALRTRRHRQNPPRHRHRTSRMPR